MKKSLVSNYIILWMHLINLTFRLFYELKLDDVQMFKLNMDDINAFLNNIFSGEYVFDPQPSERGNGDQGHSVESPSCKAEH